MRTKQTTDITEQKLALDQQLLSTLLSLGIIASVTDFSRQMGKNHTYFACMRRRGYGLHLGSLTLLVARLSKKLEATGDVRERARLRSAIEAVNANISAKCRLREEELLA